MTEEKRLAMSSIGGYFTAMKILFAVLFASLLAGCATPEEKARQEAMDRRQASTERARERYQRENADKIEAAEKRTENTERAREDARERAEDIADARRKAAEEAEEYRTFEREYARQLGKKVSQLTRDERAWIRSRF